MHAPSSAREDQRLQQLISCPSFITSHRTNLQSTHPKIKSFRESPTHPKSWSFWAKSEMGSGDEALAIDVLERPLLTGAPDGAEEEGPILYSASFDEMEEMYVKYQTSLWVVYSLLLILAWGIGLLMLLYLPLRRYVLRKDFRSRRLYITPNAIVYKVTRPVPFPRLGVFKKEKYILLPSVADVAVEQGYLQSLFGIYSIRIENVGVRRPSNDDVHIQGIANPRAFRKAVLTRLYSMKGRSSNLAYSANEHMASSSLSPFGGLTTLSKSPWMDSLQPGEMILQKLEEVKNSVKRVQNLIKKVPSETSYLVV